MSSPGAQMEMRDIRSNIEKQHHRLNHLVADDNHGHDLTPGEARSLRALESRLADIIGSLIKLAPR